MAVPPISNISGDSDSREASLSTSLLMGYIGHMLSKPKRGQEFRKRAYELLKSLIDQLAVHGPTLHFLMSDVMGNGSWKSQVLTTAYSCVPWSKEFFQRYLQMTWMSDLSNLEIPWVTSYPTDGQIHLADWISFCVDFPAWITKKVNKEILWAKQVAERSALSVLTQLAVCIEQHIRQITTQLESTKKQNRLRVPKTIKWGYVASTMDLVFSQNDSKLDSLM